MEAVAGEEAGVAGRFARDGGDMEPAGAGGSGGRAVHLVEGVNFGGDAGAVTAVGEGGDAPVGDGEHDHPGGVAGCGFDGAPEQAVDSGAVAVVAGEAAVLVVDATSRVTRSKGPAGGAASRAAASSAVVQPVVAMMTGSARSKPAERSRRASCAGQRSAGSTASPMV